MRVMAIFSTVTSIMVAFVPETHGPTLAKREAAKSMRLEKKRGGVDLRKIVGVYKQALKRPVLFFVTGEHVKRDPTRALSLMPELDLACSQNRSSSSFQSISPFSTESCEFVSSDSSYLRVIANNASARADTDSSRCVADPAVGPCRERSRVASSCQAFGIVFVEERGFKRTSYGLTYISLGLGFLVGATMVATVGSEDLRATYSSRETKGLTALRANQRKRTRKGSRRRARRAKHSPPSRGSFSRMVLPLYHRCESRSRVRDTEPAVKSRSNPRFTDRFSCLLSRLLTLVSQNEGLLIAHDWRADTLMRVSDVHWIVPCIAEFLFAISMLWIFVSFISYLIDVYRERFLSTRALLAHSLTLLGVGSGPCCECSRCRHGVSSAPRQCLCASTFLHYLSQIRY